MRPLRYSGHDLADWTLDPENPMTSLAEQLPSGSLLRIARERRTPADPRPQRFQREQPAPQPTSIFAWVVQCASVDLQRRLAQAREARRYMAAHYARQRIPMPTLNGAEYSLLLTLASESGFSFDAVRQLLA